MDQAIILTVSAVPNSDLLELLLPPRPFYGSPLQPEDQVLAAREEVPGRRQVPCWQWEDSLVRVTSILTEAP